MVVIYSGYANSGKTSVAKPALEKLGFTVLSTSEILHQVTVKMLKVLGVEIGMEDLQNKGIGFTFHPKLPNGEINAIAYERREFLGAVAERVLVPVFGRSVFPLAITNRVLQLRSLKQPIAIETVGGDEFRELLILLDGAGIDVPTIKYFNIRRRSEEPEVDCRELIDPYELYPESILKVTDIWNDGTVEDFKDKLEAYLNEA